jgi:hypothetical protein
MSKRKRKRKPRVKSIEELLLEEQDQQDEMIRVAIAIKRYMKKWQKQTTPANKRREQDNL